MVPCVGSTSLSRLQWGGGGGNMCNGARRTVNVEGVPMFVLYRHQCLSRSPMTSHVARSQVLICALFYIALQFVSFHFHWASITYNGTRFCIQKTVPGSEAPRWLHVFVKRGLSSVPWKFVQLSDRYEVMV